MEKEKDSREVIRCPWCNLNQYLARSGLCRKPECGKPLKPEDGVVTPESYYRPPVPFRHGERTSALISKQIVPAFDTGRIITNILSNVRRGKVLTKINKQPRYRKDGLRVTEFPAELRLKLIGYARHHGITLREAVIKAVEKFLDTE